MLSNTNVKVQQSPVAASKSCPDDTQHLEQEYVTVSIV